MLCWMCGKTRWDKIRNCNILFIKGLKSLRQLFGAKNDVAFFAVYLYFKKMIVYLIYKRF